MDSLKTIGHEPLLEQALQALRLEPRSIVASARCPLPAAPPATPSGKSKRKTKSTTPSLCELVLPIQAELRDPRVFVDLERPYIHSVRGIHRPSQTFGMAEATNSGEWVLDARLSPTGILVDSLLITAHLDTVIVARVDAGARGASGKSLSAGLFTADEMSGAIAAILEGRPLEPWLSDDHQTLLQSEDPLARCSAAGLVARYWTPKSNSKAELSLLLSRKGPAFAARGWYASLPQATRLAVESAFAEAVSALAAELPNPDWITGLRPDSFQHCLREWVLRRDDLESIAYLMKGHATSISTKALLQPLDAAALAQASVFSELDAEDAARLSALSWQNPDCWWGALVAD